jgi:chromosome segregation ATPase
VASVAQIEKKIADAKLTIKQSDDKLKRLRDQLRVYSGAKKLSDAQIKAAQALNKQIKDQEAAKSKASQDLDKYNKSIGDLKKLEGVDAKLKAEIASYNKALALGGKPNKSKINALLSERKNYEKTLGPL